MGERRGNIVEEAKFWGGKGLETGYMGFLMWKEEHSFNLVRETAL